jgi:hypothetical protein
MSDHDKMMAFGHWLSLKHDQEVRELSALAADRSKPIDAIRIKAGHVESSMFILQAFTDLYKEDLGKFNEKWLGKPPDAEEEPTTDG